MSGAASLRRLMICIHKAELQSHVHRPHTAALNNGDAQIQCILPSYARLLYHLATLSVLTIGVVYWPDGCNVDKSLFK